MMKSLEIDIRSAEDLKRNRRPIKRKTFAIIKIDEKTRKSNLYESGERSNPTWNHKTEMMQMNENVQFIYIQVFTRTSSGREKKIGEAKIPTMDFLGKYSSPQGYLNFLSYRLRDEYGDKCGIVNVSILVKPDSTATISSSVPSIDGYRGRIVTGLPVWGVMRIQRPF